MKLKLKGECPVDKGFFLSPKGQCKKCDAICKTCRTSSDACTSCHGANRK